VPRWCCSSWSGSEWSESCAVAPGPSCYPITDALDLAVVAAAVAGACFGFLWWNAAPAGSSCATPDRSPWVRGWPALAILTRTELLLGLLGGLVVIITLSVIIPVASFRLTRRRVFRIAPLHHHFEVVGWHAVTIVIRFWIIAGTCVLAGLSLCYAEWVVTLQPHPRPVAPPRAARWPGPGGTPHQSSGRTASTLRRTSCGSGWSSRRPDLVCQDEVPGRRSS